MKKFEGNIVNFWEYRTARVIEDVIFRSDIDENDLINVINYIEGQGYHFDNHIVFQMDNGLYVWVHDNRIIIGKSIEVGDW